MRKTFFFIVLFLGVLSDIAIGQTIEENYEERGVLLKKSKLIGLYLHSRGFGLHMSYEKQLTATTRLFYETTLSSYKHPKEIRVVNPLYFDAKSYIAGKMNTLTVNRWGIGLHKELNIKARGVKNAVSVWYKYSGGLSLGFAKPVYLNIIDYSSMYRLELKQEKYDPAKHFPDNIYGGAPSYKGLGELSVYPGVYAKMGLVFDFSKYEEVIQSIEVGAALDAYHKKIPMLASLQNNQFFLTFYIAYTIGKRYN